MAVSGVRSSWDTVARNSSLSRSIALRSVTSRAIVEKPVIYRGEIAKRSMMVLSLTFDHRVIDGAPAGAFLQTVADLLAHGNRISLDAR